MANTGMTGNQAAIQKQIDTLNDNLNDLIDLIGRYDYSEYEATYTDIMTLTTSGTTSYTVTEPMLIEFIFSGTNGSAIQNGWITIDGIEICSLSVKDSNYNHRESFFVNTGDVIQGGLGTNGGKVIMRGHKKKSN